MATAAKLLGEKLGASRCGFAEIDEAMDDVTVLRDWTDGVHSTAVGHFCMNDFGQAFIDGLSAGHAVRLDDAPSDPLTADTDAIAAFEVLEFRALRWPCARARSWAASTCCSGAVSAPIVKSG